MAFIPYGRQNIDQQDVDAVVECLTSDYLTQGPKVPQFESLVKEYCTVAYAVAVNSATSALHVACLALGVGKGDHVWTSPITFVATSNVALFCGATVDFVDIDIQTYNMCMLQLEEKLKIAAQRNELPKVVIPVHMGGQSCDMAKLALLADKYGFRVIEDASHAVGASYNDLKVGGCQYSNICIFSFHPVKIITTGEGGMAVTNDQNLSRAMKLYRSHGITKDDRQIQKEDPEAWFYEQQKLGYNYRMTDIAAALGCSQMKQLDAFVNRRRELVRRYSEHLSNLPLSLPTERPEIRSSYHLYIVKLEIKKPTRREVFDALRAADIGVNVHYIPVYRQPYYQALGFDKGYCKDAEAYYSQCITLPLYPDLSIEEQDYVISTLEAVVLN